MVEQGQIIWLNFDPQSGHEQKGKRPALVVSNATFSSVSSLAIVCPITSTDKNFPFHIKLDKRTKTTGVVLCDQVRSLDINSRGYTYVEKLPDDILSSVLEVISAFIGAD